MNMPDAEFEAGRPVRREGVEYQVMDRGARLRNRLLRIEKALLAGDGPATAHEKSHLAALLRAARDELRQADNESVRRDERRRLAALVTHDGACVFLGGGWAGNNRTPSNVTASDFAEFLRLSILRCDPDKIPTTDNLNHINALILKEREDDDRGQR